MLATVVVAVLVTAFVLVAGVAGWVVRRLWGATGEVAVGGRGAAPAATVTAPPSAQED